MTDSPGASEPRRGLLAVCITFAFSIGAVGLVSRHSDRILAGDPPEYRDRVSSILEHGLPYLSVPFEHLPVMLAPMFGAWYLGGSESQGAYVVAFAILMAAVMAAIAVVVGLTGDICGQPSANRRWLLTTVPLLPLVLFRNDPVAVLLATMAVLLYCRGSSAWWPWAALGGLAKIWPAAAGLLGWDKRKREALAVGAFGFAGLLLTYSPGFSAGRAGIGIHAETLMGSLLVLFRTLAGHAADVQITTAAYVQAPGWVPVVNAIVGLSIVAAGVWTVFRAGNDTHRVVGTGTIVVGIIMTSALLSLQYVLWVLPFVALARGGKVLVLALMLSLLTLSLGWVWSEGLFDRPLFNAAFVLRNLGLVAVALLLMNEARQQVAGED